MASQDYDVTETPTDITTGANVTLSEDTVYTVQNVGDRVVKIAIAAAAPAAADNANELDPHEIEPFSFASGEKPYMWLRDGGAENCTVVINDSV